MIKIKKLFTGMLLSLPLVCVSSLSVAETVKKYETSDSKITISKTGPLKLAPNSIEFLDFEKDISSIIVSSPDLLDISVENSKRVMIRPLTTGATSLTVLSLDGQIIYKKDILVNDRHGKFIRIRRFCDVDGAGGDCATTDTYFCPDGCYETIKNNSPTSNSGAASGGQQSQDLNMQGNMNVNHTYDTPEYEENGYEE